MKKRTHRTLTAARSVLAAFSLAQFAYAQPVIEVTPASYDFGNVEVWTTQCGMIIRWSTPNGIC